MKKTVLAFLVALLCLDAAAQEDPYLDSLQQFRRNYMLEHEVVKGQDQSLFRFFPVDKKFCIPARLEKIQEAPWFMMETSGSTKKTFRIWGILHFTIHDTAVKLPVYQSKNLMADSQYANYLFLPFLDKTSGEETYEIGRYIDCTIAEAESPVFLLDFNKAYNPYCAYVSSKYNCPVPPKENILPVAIRAGEMKFGK